MTKAVPLAAPADQRVTWVELFFDLVFVFSVTQVVTLLHGHVDLRSAGSAVLVFWLVWWAWTQFTWALNAANTDHPRVQLATLLATALAFFLAVGIPGALGSGAPWFAVPYVALRIVGLLVYDWVACENPVQQHAVRIFGGFSLGGLVAVLAGAFAGGEALYWCWSAAIVLDLVAAGIGGQRGGWDIHPDHFVERHGLVVIIALGETLIVAASGLAEAGATPTATPTATATAVLAVAVTGGLWWIYFRHTRGALEHALAKCPEAQRAPMARDVFSVIHFPMLCGVIAMAAAVEEALLHPGAPLAASLRLALGAGLVLFVGGSAVALWRATSRLSAWRVVLPMAGATGVLIGALPWMALSALLTTLAVLALIEDGRPL